MARISGITTDYPGDATIPTGFFLNSSRTSNRCVRDSALVSPKNLSICDVLRSHYLSTSGISMLARLSSPDGLAIIGSAGNDKGLTGSVAVLFLGSIRNDPLESAAVLLVPCPHSGSACPFNRHSGRLRPNLEGSSPKEGHHQFTKSTAPRFASGPSDSGLARTPCHYRLPHMNKKFAGIRLSPASTTICQSHRLSHFFWN